MRKLLCLVMAVLVTGCAVRVGSTPARTIGPGPNDPTVHYVIGGSLVAFGLGLALYDSQVDTDDNQDDIFDSDGLVGAVGILLAIVGVSTLIRASIVAKRQQPAPPPQGYPPPGYPPPQPQPYPQPYPQPQPQPYPQPQPQPYPQPYPQPAPTTQPAPQPYPPAPTPVPAPPPPPPSAP